MHNLCLDPCVLVVCSPKLFSETCALHGVWVTCVRTAFRNVTHAGVPVICALSYTDEIALYVQVARTKVKS